jgi:tetratricopeptide (TPR) repeat protein
MNLEEKFWEGHQALLNNRFITAKKLFTEIVNDKNASSFQYLSGAYVNLARAIFELGIGDGNKRNNEVDLIKKYLEIALQIKPSNQAALSFSVTIFMFTKEYRKAIEAFFNISAPDVKQHSLQFIYFLELSILEKDERILEALPSIECLYKDYSTNPRVVNIMANTYIANEDFNKSYFVLRKYIDETTNKKSSETLSLYNTLVLICATALHKPEEGIEYALKCIQIINTLPSKRQKDLELIKESIFSNLAMAYGQLHEYNKVVEILTPKVKINPNNTDFFNLSHAHFRLKNFDVSISLCQKALYVLTDEQSLYLMAENLYYLGKYKEALDYYKKAVSFLDVNNKLLLEFTDGNNQELRSNIFGKEKTIRDIYVGLIQCYIALEDYISAKAASTYIKEKWEFDDELNKISNNIDLFLNKQESQNQVIKKLSELNRDIELQKQNFEKEILDVKEWAIRLIKLQGRCFDKENNINLNEADWRVIMKQMHEIAIEMKNNSQTDDGNFDLLKNNFKGKFPNISEEGLAFLTTGEYLYQAHKEGTLDFAPIMVEFSKVIETELNRLFKKKQLIKKKDNLTLGQLQYTIKNIKISNVPELYQFLDEVVSHRNGSAHTGLSTRKKVEKIRELIFDKRWLEKILSSL